MPTVTMRLAGLFSAIMCLGTCFGHVEQRETQKVGVCPGVSHTFGLATFGCQRTYTILNITLQRRTSPCLLSTTFTSAEGQVPGDECSTRYVNLIFRGIQIYSQCDGVCESDFPYRFQHDISQSSGCCQQGDSDCLYDQIWVYYWCDVIPTTSTAISPSTTDDSRWPPSLTRKTPRSSETYSVKPTTASSNISCRDRAHAGSTLRSYEQEAIAHIVFSTVIAILTVAVITLIVLYCRNRHNSSKLPGNKLRATSLGSLTTWRYVAKSRDIEGGSHDVTNQSVTLGRYLNADGGVHVMTLHSSAPNVSCGHLMYDIETGSKFVNDCNRSMTDNAGLRVRVECDTKENTDRSGSDIGSATSSRLEQPASVDSEHSDSRILMPPGNIHLSRNSEIDDQVDSECSSLRHRNTEHDDIGTRDVHSAHNTDDNSTDESHHDIEIKHECSESHKHTDLVDEAKGLSDTSSITSDCVTNYCNPPQNEHISSDICDDVSSYDNGITFISDVGNCISAK